MFEVRFDFDKRDMKKIEEMPDLFRKGLVEGMNFAMLFAEGEAKKSFNTTGHLRARSGHLRRSIRHKLKIRSSKLTGSIGSDVIYARIHELGGTIRPRAGNDWLRFPIGNKWVTTKQVKIPARPYLRPAIEDNFSDISKIILNNIMERLYER